MMNDKLAEYTTEELKAEILRRERPDILEITKRSDSELIRACKVFLDMEERGENTVDEERAVCIAAMEFIYGRKIWPYINSLNDE
jgi:hypothetical protein